MARPLFVLLLMIRHIQVVASGVGALVAEDPIPLQCYDHRVVQFNKQPVVAWDQTPGGTAAFAQVYNPTWLQASSGTSGKSGLLLRTQNCTDGCGHNITTCCACDPRKDPSYITFAELLNDDNGTNAPKFSVVTNSSIVFGPYDASTALGTEDPRIAFDATTQTYIMLYTCYGSKGATLCMATSRNPLNKAAWHVVGDLGFGDGSKSGALLIRDKGPHFLYWGAGAIRVTNSTNLTKWASPGVNFIHGTLWGNRKVEAGPPPLRLSTGDYILFHNSWPQGWEAPAGHLRAGGYEPAWVILNGSDLTQIIARAPVPLWSPSLEPWMNGVTPYYCNAPTVAFLEAAHPTAKVDEFRLYFGGADMVTGSAVVKITKIGGVQCNGTMPNINYN
jgi:predicted GH43/DUF377 family glycosyl hydrolase